MKTVHAQTKCVNLLWFIWHEQQRVWIIGCPFPSDPHMTCLGHQLLVRTPAMWFKAGVIFYVFCPIISLYKCLLCFLPLYIFRMEPKSTVDVEGSVGNAFPTRLRVSPFKYSEHSDSGHTTKAGGGGCSVKHTYLVLLSHFWLPETSILNLFGLGAHQGFSLLNVYGFSRET